MGPKFVKQNSQITNYVIIKIDNLTKNLYRAKDRKEEEPGSLRVAKTGDSCSDSYTFNRISKL